MTGNSPSARTVFFVSDHSGVTAQTMGHSLLTQFEGVEFRGVTLPFVVTVEKALETQRRIDAAAAVEKLPPLVFSTLVRESERSIVRSAKGLYIDLLEPFLRQLETALGQAPARAQGRSHSMFDLEAYMTRIAATDYALTNDDGGASRDYERADVILVGVSRSGKTPTCLYLALQHGVYAANYPLLDEDLESAQLPAPLQPFASKLFGLVIAPDRLRQIRQARRPDSRYASAQQVDYELRASRLLFERFGIPHLDTTHRSVEELASRILQLRQGGPQAAGTSTRTR
jgi:[pyruvate, water dikinase]-phosphate phosphotransferase / [pyruvate, water dikinase] kinase